MPAKRQDLADFRGFFKEVEQFTDEVVLPEMKRLFEQTHDSRLKADLARWFASYGHGQPIARTEVKATDLESILIEFGSDRGVIPIDAPMAALPAGPDDDDEDDQDDDADDQEDA